MMYFELPFTTQEQILGDIVEYNQKVAKQREEKTSNKMSLFPNLDLSIEHSSELQNLESNSLLGITSS